MRHVWISPAPTPPLIWKRCLFKLVSLLRALCHKNKSSSAGQESSLPNEGTETEYVPIWQRPPKVPPKESLPIGVSSSQQQCSFFSLPIELRDLIYRQVFGHSLIHIITVRKRIAHIVCVEHRLAHLKCPNRRSGDGWDGHEHGVYGTEAGTTVLEDSLYMNDQLLALCLSCRRIYNEALPLMYSEPLFVISKPARIFLVDHAKFFTLRNIRKLHVRMYFFNFPQEEGPSDKWCNMAGWIHICNSLASMPNLTYLCITIVQDAFRLESRSPDRNVELLNGIFEPLNSIKVVSEGEFDIVTQGWKLPFELTDVPFQLLEERPPITPLAKFRLQELGGLSEPIRRSPVSIPKARPFHH